MATYEPTTTGTPPPVAPTPAPTPTATEPRYEGSSWARWINIVLGAWLFISAFAWPHTPASANNTWIVGVLIAAVAIVATYAPNVRWVNTALAVWLFFSTLVIVHATPATTWNNAIVAVIVFIASLTPTQRFPSPGQRRQIPSAA